MSKLNLFSEHLMDLGRQAIKQSGSSREGIFITTKLWIQDAGYERTKKAFAKSLEQLQVDYLDLYLIHRSVLRTS